MKDSFLSYGILKALVKRPEIASKVPEVVASPEPLEIPRLEPETVLAAPLDRPADPEPEPAVAAPRETPEPSPAAAPARAASAAES